MALSAEERRQWRELERQLTPNVPTVPQPIRNQGTRRRMAGVAGSILGLIVVVVAFAVVILAVLVKVLFIGVVGFVLMIFGGTRLRPASREAQPAKVISPTSGDVL